MSLVEQFASERKARLTRLGAIPTNRIVSQLTEAQIVPVKPTPTIFVPSVEYFYQNFWCWDLVICQNRLPSTIKNIQQVVSDHYRVSVMDIVSQRRTIDVVLPRHVALYLVKSLTTFSYPVIGRYFGGRDHSTIISAVKKIEARIETEDRLRSEINRLMGRFA